MKYTYTIPEKMRSAEAPVSKVMLKKLTGIEQETAFERAGQNPARLGAELVKMSIVAFDGKPLDAVSDEVSEIWNKLDPKVRNLITEAYQKHHAVNEEESKGFFASEVVEG